MTFTYIPKSISTEGQRNSLNKLITAVGITVRGVVKDSITSGGEDIDYLTIKASASVVNLTEEETYDLVDKIRSKIKINQ